MRSPFLVNADQALSKVAVRLLVGGYVALGALNAQAAATADLQPAFGNTVVSTYPDGRSLQVWLHPDGSWEGQSRRGTALAGHWNVKGDKVCFRARARRRPCRLASARPSRSIRKSAPSGPARTSPGRRST
jgi:hypothetical protein